MNIKKSSNILWRLFKSTFSTDQKKKNQEEKVGQTETAHWGRDPAFCLRISPVLDVEARIQGPWCLSQMSSFLKSQPCHHFNFSCQSLLFQEGCRSKPRIYLAKWILHILACRNKNASSVSLPTWKINSHLSHGSSY